ncbi:MAG: hypothetical protein Q8R53_05770 [Nanoarchaeota archaeon]|nr:hypothetical protein [Nanoarchaeota archaeon]
MNHQKYFTRKRGSVALLAASLASGCAGALSHQEEPTIQTAAIVQAEEPFSERLSYAEQPRFNASLTHLWGEYFSREEFERQLYATAMPLQTEELWLAVEHSRGGVRWYEVGREESADNVERDTEFLQQLFAQEIPQRSIQALHFYHNHPPEGRAFHPPSYQDLASYMFWSLLPSVFIGFEGNAPIHSHVLTPQGMYTLQLNRQEGVDDLSIADALEAFYTADRYSRTLMDSLGRSTQQRAQLFCEALSSPYLTITFRPGRELE